jgi:hypothetical protein
MLPPVPSGVSAPAPYRVRALPPEEWTEKIAAGELAHYPVLPDPQFTIIVVVENTEGVIVASWLAMNTVHLEGLYIDPNHRQSVGVAVRLFSGMIEALQRAGVPQALTIASSPTIARMAETAGFAPIDGDLYRLLIPPSVEDR